MRYSYIYINTLYICIAVTGTLLVHKYISSGKRMHKEEDVGG